MSEYKNDPDDITELKEETEEAEEIEETEETEEGVETVNEDKPLGTTRNKINLAIFLIMAFMVGLFFLTEGSIVPLTIAAICFITLLFTGERRSYDKPYEGYRKIKLRTGEEDQNIASPMNPLYRRLYGTRSWNRSWRKF